MAATRRSKEKVGCTLCGYAVSRYHLKRHRMSEGHRDRLRMRGQYQELPSDRAFTIFLHSIRRGDLRPFERRLFDEMKAA
jgi:hypothetical protein